MLHIAGGIILAVLIMIFWAEIIALILAASGVVIFLAIAVAIVAIFLNYPEIGFFIIACAVAIKLINWIDNWIDNEISKNSGTQPINLNSIQQIGGLKLWIRDIRKRYTPTITVNQKIEQRKYIDAERPQLFLDAANMREIEFKKKLETNKREQEQSNEKQKPEFLSYTRSITNKLDAKFSSNFNKLKQQFHKQKDVIFVKTESNYYVRILKNESVLRSYELCIEVRTAPKPTNDSLLILLVTNVFPKKFSTLVLYYIVDERNKTTIVSSRSIKLFNEKLKEIIINDLANSKN